MESNLITQKQLCKSIGVSEPTIIKLRKEGKIRAIELGSRRLYDLQDVLTDLKKNAYSKKEVA